MWPTNAIDTWDQFVVIATSLVRSTYPTAYMFRGQSQASWDLTPSLVRLLPPGLSPSEALRVERRLLDDFRSQTHLHVPAEMLPTMVRASAPPEWWAIMQHYGAPTRLLDWTQSPYVAAYFAVERDWDVDGAVFMVHANTAQRSYHEHFGADGNVAPDVFTNVDAPRAVLFWHPDRKSARSVAQQAFLSVSTNLVCSHEELILPACAEAAAQQPGKLFHHRWTIPAAHKPWFLRNLRAMNIAAHSLFPGLDGACRSAAEDARLAFTGEQPNQALHPTADLPSIK